MKVRIGSSPCSWGVNFASDPKQSSWQRFLDELIQADYEWIELAPYGYLPTDLKILRPELERRNLKAVACDVMLPLEDLALWPVIKEEALKDVYPTPFDKPLPIAKRTRAYLREIGIG